MTHLRPPTWVSPPRIILLIASFLVALGSGTNYVYSAFSPQLGARLNISHTQLNIIALAGNAGVYSSAPVWGKIVDSRGPGILLVISFACLLGGYSGIKYLYDSGLSPDTSTLPALSFYTLVLCNFLTGSGSLAGLTSSLNVTVKSFPDEARASTTGLVMAGFGLSAFFFTALSNTIFRTTTSTFLLILALGPSSLMVLGFFLVRPIPLSDETDYRPLEDGDDIQGALSPSSEHHNNSRTPLLNNDSMGGRHARYTRTDVEIDGEYSSSIGGITEVAQTSDQKHCTLNIHGRALWCNLDFWLLFSIYSMLAGTGYTYINNVGAISRSLYAHNNSQYDEAQALGWQATQVAVISLTNSGGRILIGFLSDFTKSRYKTPRSHAIILVAFIYFISQVIASNVSDISNLWIASVLLGLGHGSMSSLLPPVCLEWFGLPHFSENWGYVCLSPVFSANLLSFLFGRTLDAHGHKIIHHFYPSALYAYNTPPQCLQGRDCYVEAIYLTIGATFLSFLISIWAGYRDSQKAVNGE